MYLIYILKYINFFKLTFCKGFFENGPRGASIHRINKLSTLKPSLVCSSTSVVMLLLLLSLSCTLCSAQLGPLALLMENNAQINSNRRQHHPGCNLRTHYLDSKHFPTFYKPIFVLDIL